jgi:GTPase SAR1 family protein
VVRTKIDKGVPGQPFERAFADFTNAFWSDKDATITKGDTYSYEIWLKKQSGNRWIESNHLTAEVVVSGSIPVLLDFKVTETGIPGKVDISYRKPAEDNVEVNIYQIKGLPSSDLQEAKVMTEKEPRPATSMDSPEIGRFLGKKINLDEKPEFNEGIVTIRGVSIPSDEVGSRTFSAVSTLGGNARISAMFVVYQIGRMEGAEIIDRYDYQLIRVQLPMEASLLQVWIANPEDTWEQQDLKNPTREVYIQSEYLKNGGILFTDSDSTLPASVTKLDNSPKRIFIRGTANYEGNENPSPNVAIVDYKGRIEVHHRLQAIQEPAEKKGWLRKAEVGPVVNQVQVKVVAPSGSGSTVRVLALVSNKSAGFQIRTNSPEVSPETLNINTTQHINWMPVKTGISGEGSFLQIGLDKQVRLVPQNVADNLIPVFVIDEDIDNAKLKLPKPNPAEKTYKVILVGTKKSGKTTYVQALVNYLKNQLAPRYEASLEPKSPAANRRLIDLEAFLASGKLPESTPKASQFGPTATDDENDPRTPIRFNLEGSSQVPFTTIELFDVAGEDMNNGDIALYKNELLAADLIIFLFDPMQVKEFVERAPGSVTEVDSTVSPRTVLNTIHDIVVDNPDRRPNQKIAVTVSKFDALGVVIESGFEGSISKGMSVTRDPNSWVNRFFNERDALQVQQEAIALLAQVPSNKAFTAYALENFDNLHFFVASSLGQDNWGQYIDKTGMTSFRIADPILWMAIPSVAVSNNPGSQPR